MKRRFFGLNKKRRDTSKNYFTIEVLEDGLLVKLPNNYEYCIDNGFWNKATPLTYINANAGLSIYFKGNLIPSDYSGIGNFTITKKCNLSGNIMSLLYRDEFEEQTNLTGKNWVFLNLFSNCYTIIDASQLILPATTLADGCYDLMFRSCDSLITAPELPATTLTYDCYSYMFQDCTSLVTPPELPATTLAEHCYSGMFFGCKSLTTAPELPATSLTNYCYYGMFYNCSSLVAAPTLPAISLAPGCYDSMFHECRSLTQSPELPATTLANVCYRRMFWNCSSLVTAPELPATTLVSGCYDCMFFSCAKLNYIKALFTTTPSSSYTDEWVKGVSSTGTFVKNAHATWDVNGIDGIPTGWTVQTA